MASDSKEKVILYCHNLYANPGGGEYAVYRDDVELLKKGGQTVVKCEENNTKILEATWAGKVGHIIRSFYNPNTVKRISSLAERYHIMVAIVQNTYLMHSPSIYRALHSHGIPIIQMIYNYRFICPNAHLYTRGQICHKCVQGNYLYAVNNKCIRSSHLKSLWYAMILLVMRRILKVDRLIDRFITPDEFLKKMLMDGNIPGEKIRVIKNPYIHKNVLISNKDDGYFLFVGRLVRQKGIYTFLEAAKRLRQMKFVVIGEGEELESIGRMIEEEALRNVQLMGPVFDDPMKEVMSRARAVVIPSEWYDNYPVVISQAYAYGKAVIASAINGIPEVVIDGKTGLLFQYGSALDLAEKLTVLHNDAEYAKQLGRAGRKFLEKELSSRLELLQSVLCELMRAYGY